MKFITLLLTFSMTFQLAAMSHKNIGMEENPSILQKQTDDEQTTRWDYISAISGVVGLAFAFIPYLSLLGILLGAAAIVFSIFAFRKKQKKRWAWLGMITGGLTMVAFLGVIGLLTFF